jgi:2-oxoglutarate ferredoxin oxidoreductase subunit alpha
VQQIAKHYEPTQVFGDERGGLLMVSWGGTFGAVREAVTRARKRGQNASHVHLRNLSPLPNDLGEILRRYDRVLVAELNLGQLNKVLRAEYLVDARSYAKIQGQPFKVAELEDAIRHQLEAN